MVSLPIGKNKVLLRIENLDDRLDKGFSTKIVNLDAVVNSLWQDANSGSAFTYSFVEMSLTANMLLSEMLDRKVMWQTRDDALKGSSRVTYDSSDPTSIAVEPQRIRVFEVHFKPDIQS